MRPIATHTSTLALGLALAAGVALGACQSPPAPLSSYELSQSAQALRGTLEAGAVPVTQPITLSEAMARALQNNLDHRVAMMEADLAARDHELTRWDQLPGVVASGGYFGRANEAGASSLSLLSGRQSLEPSTSLEREYYAGDLSASWNILDFGLSRIRAQQLGDEAMIAEERRRKAVISIMEDVHRAYWRAVSAERLAARLDTLQEDVDGALADSRRLHQGRRTAPMPALSFQRELHDIQGQAQRLRRELAESRAELASLMALAPGQAFALDAPARFSTPRGVEMEVSEMIDVALRQRPEVREAAYAVRIGEAGIRKAALEALPSLEGFAGLNLSSNDFLFNQDWVGYGARASWNVMSVFETPARKRRAGALAELERRRALASAMAVMTQVAVSRTRWEMLADEYATSEEAARVQTDITRLVDAQAAASSASRQTQVRERMNAILADARRDAAHARMREAAARMQAAMGFDPFPAGVTGEEDLATLADALATLWADHESGSAPLAAVPTAVPTTLATADTAAP